MQNPELCTELLHRILPDLKIDRIEYPELQKTIKPHIFKTELVSPSKEVKHYVTKNE